METRQPSTPPDADADDMDAGADPGAKPPLDAGDQVVAGRSSGDGDSGGRGAQPAAGGGGRGGVGGHGGTGGSGSGGTGGTGGQGDGMAPESVCRDQVCLTVFECWLLLPDCNFTDCYNFLCQ